MEYPRRASSFDKHTISSIAKKRVKFFSSERQSLRSSSIGVLRTARNTETPLSIPLATPLATPLAIPLATPHIQALPANNLNVQAIARLGENQDDFNISWLFQDVFIRQARTRDRPQAQQETRSLRSRGQYVNYKVSFSYFYHDNFLRGCF
jgi:hypothetical protein